MCRMLQNLFSFKISLGLLLDKAPIFLSRSKCLSMKLTLKRSVFIGIVKFSGFQWNKNFVRNKSRWQSFPQYYLHTFILRELHNNYAADPYLGKYFSGCRTSGNWSRDYIWRCDCDKLGCFFVRGLVSIKYYEISSIIHWYTLERVWRRSHPMPCSSKDVFRMAYMPKCRHEIRLKSLPVPVHNNLLQNICKYASSRQNRCNVFM